MVTSEESVSSLQAEIEARLATSEPGVGALYRARNQFAGVREIVRRPAQRTQRRQHEIIDLPFEAFQFVDQLPRDQQRQRVHRIGDRALRRCLARGN